MESSFSIVLKDPPKEAQIDISRKSFHEISSHLGLFHNACMKLIDYTSDKDYSTAFIAD